MIGRSLRGKRVTIHITAIAHAKIPLLKKQLYYRCAADFLMIRRLLLRKK